MAKICISEKTVSRQLLIENGLIELMQQTKYEEITVAELCRHLNLPRRSFYRYFRNMDDVLDSLMNHTLQKFASSDSVLNVRKLERDFTFWLNQKPLLQALSNSGLNNKIAEYTLRYVDEDMLRKSLAASDLNMDISREVNLFVVTGLSALVVAWYEDGFQKTPEQMANIAHRMLSIPILANK